MAGKTLINGTAYTVKGGTTKVNGTGSKIARGKTKIDGTAWTIAFGRLPSGYTEVEYIKNTGASYIDSQYACPLNGFKAKCKISEDEKKSFYQWFCGVIDNGGNGAGECAFGDSWGDKKWRTGFNGAAAVASDFFNLNQAYELDVTIIRGEQKLYADNVLKCSAAGTGNAYAGSIFIFTENYRGSPRSDSFWFGKCYHLQLYTPDGVLVRDFVPCINPSNQVGMYDLVTNQFFGNSGSGSFIAGNPV